jgi:transposase
LTYMEDTSKKGFLRKSQKDYSLAFKLQVVDQVEKGLLTYKQAQLRYGIQGRSTVLVWLRKHGQLDWKHKRPMKEKQPPRSRIHELEARIKRLEQEKMILNRAIDIADEQFGTNIRKKYLPLSLKAFRPKGQQEPPESN